MRLCVSAGVWPMTAKGRVTGATSKSRGVWKGN